MSAKSPRSSRRALLVATAGALVAGSAKPGAAVHPDVDLLALCARLAAMQAEWHRLWHFTGEDWGLDDPPLTPADNEWLAYNDHVWLGISLASGAGIGAYTRHPDDLLGQLQDLHPTTLEGLRAKAAAILAADDAGCYGADICDDWHDLTQSILRDVTGAQRCLMGEDAEAPA